MIDYFDFDKTVELLQKKYYWIDCVKQTNEYVKIYNICQRIKTFRHKLYNKFSFLSISKNFWKKIIWDFIIEFSLNKRKKIVYDFIFVIMNRCIKIIKYISTIIKYNNVELTKFFFEKIVFNFDMFEKIINDQNSIFINVF